MNLINKLRQNFFLIAIAILTLTLLVVFGVEQGNEKNSDRGDVVSDFYFTTLKPLFTSESIDNKDVLNFALEGDLLLDEADNKVLQLSNDSTGREVIGIKSWDSIAHKDNYAIIVEKLKLEEGQRKEKLDSILELYSNELSKSIYKDENKAFAVDPEISLIRKLLNQELSNFVKDENSNKNLLNQLAKNREQEAIRDYLVFTSDTVFQREYEYITPKISEPEKVYILAKDLNKVEKPSIHEGNELNFHIDSNFVNVTLNDFIDIDEFENIHFFKAFIDSTEDNLKLSLEILGDSLDNLHLKFSYADSANNKIRYEMNSDEIGNAITNSLKIFSGKDLEEWIEFGIKMDSISRMADKKSNLKKENN